MASVSPQSHTLRRGADAPDSATHLSIIDQFKRRNRCSGSPARRGQPRDAGEWTPCRRRALVACEL